MCVCVCVCVAMFSKVNGKSSSGGSARPAAAYGGSSATSMGFYTDEASGLKLCVLAAVLFLFLVLTFL